MQTSHLLAASERQSALQIVSALGLSGLYKGTALTLCRDIPYALVFFPLYATLKDVGARRASAQSGLDVEASIGSIVLAGLIAGATAAAVVTPGKMTRHVTEKSIVIVDPSNVTGKELW